MASTPSASALSAVLRSQGNILARKGVNQTRPAASVYGLGMKSSNRSFFRTLLGFIFNREIDEIPGVWSVSTQLKRRSAVRITEDHLVKNSTLKNCRKTKPKTDYYGFAFNSERFSLLSKNSAVLRVCNLYVGKTTSENPRTFCICIVCAHGKSALNQHEVDSLFPIVLLSLLKKRLTYLTAAVSDIMRTKLGIDRTNQIYPDCNKQSGGFEYNTEDHTEAEFQTLQGEASEIEK